MGERIMTPRLSVLKYCFYWFLVSGSIGIMIALLLAAIASNRSLNPALILTLWPSSIVGLADPTTLSAKIIIGVYEFGGNFLLYGVIGTAAGLAFRLGNSSRHGKL
jgi:hypothetical protein